MEITVNKKYVYDEVAKTTSYAGAKQDSDKGAYDRIFVTDSDKTMLERFWREACNASTELMKDFIYEVSENDTDAMKVDITANYIVKLTMPSNFDEGIENSISSSLLSYFVNYITSKWFSFCNKNDTTQYATFAIEELKDVKQKLYFRKKPKRIIPQIETK